MGNNQVMLTEEELRRRASEKYSNKPKKDDFRVVGGNDEATYTGEERLESKDRLKGNSTSGATGRRRKKMIHISESEYIHRLKTVAIASALTASIAVGATLVGGAHVVSNVNEFLVESSIQNELYDSFSPIVSSNTHITKDNQHHWYDYAKIADAMEDYESYDIAVLSCYMNLGRNQTNKVMNYSKYDSFDNYLKEKGFADAKEYKEFMIDQIRLQQNLDKKQEELNRMTDDHNIDIDNKSEGASYHG